LPPPATLSSVTVRADGLAWAALERGPAPYPARGREEASMMLTVGRSYDFSASHRLHAPALTDDENEQLFGKCHRPSGHGHNYGLDVVLTGEADVRTGLLVDPDRLDRIVQEEILDPFDHRYLNVDRPEFADLNPTSENLVVVIWGKLSARLRRDLPSEARLYRVAIHETARNTFEYFGPDRA
jgi:6-pyruvoyltetrahydropterin/6-carboxytetrahydropterin synthase